MPHVLLHIGVELVRRRRLTLKQVEVVVVLDVATVCDGRVVTELDEMIFKRELIFCLVEGPTYPVPYDNPKGISISEAYLF